MRTCIAALTVASVFSTLIVAGAEASPTQVNVRIEGRTETLFEGPILTEGHNVEASSDSKERPCDGVNFNDPQNTTPGPTPTAASVDAMHMIGETFDGEWNSGFEDYFLTQWGSKEENAQKEGKSWGILVNNVYLDVGGCQYELSAGGEVLWIFNAFESKAILGLFATNEDYTAGERPLTATAQLGKPFEVEVVNYGGDGEDAPPATPNRTNAVPYEGADISPVLTSAKGFERIETTSPETVATDSEGKASIMFTTPGWHRIKAGTALNAMGEEKAIRSNRLDVCVPAIGETSCGELPAEDEVRALPQYLEEHHEETPTTGGPLIAPGPSTTPSPPLTPTPAHTASVPVASLTVESINRTQLLLELTAPGKPTVKIAQLRGKGQRRHWQTIKTIAVNAGEAGALKIKLPRLVAGSYRVSISLAGVKTVVKALIVPRTR